MISITDEHRTLSPAREWSFSLSLLSLWVWTKNSYQLGTNYIRQNLANFNDWASTSTFYCTSRANLESRDCNVFTTLPENSVINDQKQKKAQDGFTKKTQLQDSNHSVWDASKGSLGFWLVFKRIKTQVYSLLATWFNYALQLPSTKSCQSKCL